MGKGVGKKPRGGVMRTPERPIAPSARPTRCRATTDVPYTVRCVLDASHVLDLTQHDNGKGVVWWR